MMLVLGYAYANAQSTNVAIGPTILQPSVKRIGINLSFEDFYDSGQMTKSLVFRNPGFEGEIFNSTIRCASGTATTCVDDDAYSGWPAGFWNNATFEVFYGASQGRTGTITGYTAANGTTGGTFTFSNSAVAPATGDYMIVRMNVPGNATAGWWPTTSGAGAITTNTTDLPPGTTGLQTAAVNAPTANDYANLAAYFDTTSGKTFVLLNGTFQLTFQAKATGGSNSLSLHLARSGSAAYLNQVVSLTNSWATYTFNFTAAENAATPNGVALQFSTIGQDSFLLDNVSLTQTNTDPTNTSAFRDPVVNALKVFHPGVLRFWAGQLGDTLDNLIADPYSRKRSGYLAWYTEQDDISYGLQEFLQLCEVIGAEPWVVVPSTFSTTDASNLIEYLAGASTSPYGAKRAARGQASPWTSAFAKIHLEFGNEAWNGTFKGGSIEYSAPYGQRAQTIFGAMRGNASYISSAFDLVLGGQAAWAGRNQDIQNNCNNNDSFAVAPYMMNTVTSFSDNEDLFGSTFAEPEAYQSSAGTAEGVTGLMLQNQQAIQSSNHPVPISLYEMNLSTTQGTITQAALNTYASSLGAGLAVADSMLQQMGQGILTQNLFALPQYQFVRPDGSLVDLWGAVIDMGVTDRRRPQYLAIEVANQAIGNNAAMLQTVQSGANPTWNQPLVNTVQLSGAHYLQSFAFSNSSGNSVVLLNLHRTASLPVTFSGPNAPAGAVQLTLLTSANLTDTNEAAQVVTPASSTVNNFNSSTPLSLPPYSMTVLTWAGGSPITPTLPVITSVTATGITSNSATINWTTSPASNSQVEYGTTTGYGSLSTVNNSLVTSHSAALTGLASGTTYNYAVLSENSSGTLATSANFALSTLAGAIPAITSVTATSITPTSATVTWTTDVTSTTQLEYGTTASYGSLAALNNAMVTSHTVALSGLTPGIVYDYAALSMNSAGTLGTSANFTFATTAASTGSGGSSIAVTGKGCANWSYSPSTSCTWTPNAPSVGNSIHCFVFNFSTSTGFSLTDNAGTPNTYTQNGSTYRGTANGGYYALFDDLSVSNGSLTKTTVNLSGSGAFFGLSCYETTGGSEIVDGPVGTGSASSGLVSATLNPTGSADFGSCGISSSNSLKPGAGYTAIATTPSSPTTSMYKMLSAFGSQTATATIGSGTDMICATYSSSSSHAANVISSVTATGITSSSATVTYATSQPSTSQVEFGNTTSYGSETMLSSSPVTSHSVTLLNLTSGTTYNYAVLSENSSGTLATSGNFTFSTTAGPAPVITSATATGITSTSATITWTTDQASTTALEYGTTLSYGSLSALNSALITSHTVALSGLIPGTTYDYAALSGNSAGALATSANLIFATTGTASGSGGSAIAVTGKTCSSFSYGNSTACRWSSPPAVGETIHCFLFNFATTTGFGVTDNAGTPNTYTQNGSTYFGTGSSGYYALFDALSVTNGSLTSTIANVTGNGVFFGLSCYSTTGGSKVVDGPVVGASASSGTASATVNPSSAGDFASCGVSSSNSLTPGAGYTAIATVPDSPTRSMYKTLTGSGSQIATAAILGGTDMMCGTYK